MVPRVPAGTVTGPRAVGQDGGVTEERPEIRIGDRERKEVDDRLRAAHDDGRLTLTEYDERSRAAFGARFRSELDPLLADLPDDDPPPVAARTPPPAEVPTTTAEPTWHDDNRFADRGERRDLRRGRRRGHLGFRGVLVAGVVVVAAAVAPGVLTAAQGGAVFGSRTVQVTPDESSVSVGVLFGSTKVVVPDDAQVTTDGTTIFGSTDCDAACAPRPPGARQIEVTGRGAFGSIEVQTTTEAAQRQNGDDRDDD